MTENIKKFKQLKHLDAYTKKEIEFLNGERNSFLEELSQIKSYIQRVDTRKNILKEHLSDVSKNVKFSFSMADIKLTFAKLLKVNESELDFVVCFNNAQLVSSDKVDLAEYSQTKNNLFVSIYVYRHSDALKRELAFKIDLMKFIDDNKSKINYKTSQNQLGENVYSFDIKKGEENTIVFTMSGLALMQNSPEFVNTLLQQDAISQKKKPTLK